jgi:hypothetical protein
MQLALEALENAGEAVYARGGIAAVGSLNIAAQALRQALETEPFEYWTAVEGWVKIDEVREHFDSVGCGTIYKSAGEGRSPLYTAPPKREWVGLTDEQIIGLWQDTKEPDGHRIERFAHAMEQALKEKNT